MKWVKIFLKIVLRILEILKDMFFSVRAFFHGHWRLTGQQRKGGHHLLFHSTASSCSRTFRYLFTTSHVRWLSHIFNRNPCIYQTATRWDFPPYWITIWLTDWWCSFIFCLFTGWFDLKFCCSNLTRETGELELASTITLLAITTEPTNLVC